VFGTTGYVDAFRVVNQEAEQYTWWSYRSQAWAKNVGWRIDYHLASKELENKLKRAVILSDAKHSDHCPILLELK
jgi:exodeoxyribonuclease-3